MKIIESYVKGKMPGGHVCEDMIAVSDDFIAVFDGVSSKSDIRYEGKTTGYVAVQLMSDALKHVPPRATAEECFRAINNAVYMWYEKEGLLSDVEINPRNRPAASAAVYSRVHNQIWVIGDCQAFFGGESHTFPLRVDEFYIELRMKVIGYLKAIGKTTEELLQKDISAAMLRPLFELQPLLQNAKNRGEYSYSILDGFELCASDIKTLHVPSGINEICLATDGYPAIFGSLKESEEYLQHVLTSDPLCCDIFKHTKGARAGHESFDDRAYVRFLVD